MKTGKSATANARWKSNLYLYPARRALAFADRHERDRLLASLWDDQQFYGMPRDYAGALLLVVPEEAVALLRKKGLKFSVRDAVSG